MSCRITKQCRNVRRISSWFYGCCILCWEGICNSCWVYCPRYGDSTTPSWTVDLNLYGNVAPSVSAPTVTFQNSGSEISASFTISQSVFNGELQDIVKVVVVDAKWYPRANGTETSDENDGFSTIVFVPWFEDHLMLLLVGLSGFKSL